MKYILAFLVCIVLYSCSETEKERITRLVKEWEGKEILFPDDIVYTVYGLDTVNYLPPESDYKIVHYNDSIGCTSCKLQMNRWTEYIIELDSLTNKKVSFHFIFHPKDKKELSYLLKRDTFKHPVWIDNKDQFNNINSLPEERIFHSFLLSSDNKVVAIGDPVQNPKIKGLYEKVITGEVKSINHTPTTTIRLEKTEIDLGTFDWKETQKANFILHNIGSNVLVVNDVVTSCGCMTVEYSREPVRPGGQLELTVIYKADHSEYVDKSLKVFSNIDSSLLILRVKGNAN